MAEYPGGSCVSVGGRFVCVCVVVNGSLPDTTCCHRNLVSVVLTDQLIGR